ncbi:hypothetical protein GCM10027418_03610 [Mariniluteicoccus endophyticus]
MGFYARPSWQLWRQVAADLFMVVWTVLWWQISRVVAGAISAIAAPARETAQAAGKLRADFVDAGAKAGNVPLAGDELRKPFESAAGSMGDVVAAAESQVHLIEQVSSIVGILVVAIPVALLFALWFPRRLRFRAESMAARRFIDSPADLDLFALRAMANQPMHLIAKISDDPVSAWRDGDQDVIDRLADLELRRSGLPRPAGATAAVTD